MTRLFAHHKVVALTVVATLFLSGIVATGSQPLHFAPINVSREQYDAALAKWNNLNVEEYEEIVRTWTGCRYKLVVSIDRSTGTPVETTVDSEDLQVPSIGGCLHDGANPTDTVGTLFSLVDYVLANPSEAATNPYHGFSQWYSAEFDKDMGYPRYYAAYGGLTMETTIEALKVLR